MTKIRSIGVFSAAKVNALLWGIAGLLIAPFLLLGPGLAMTGGGHRPAGVAGIVVMATTLPFIYALLGFCAGAVMAFLYNTISHSVGGIEIEVESAPLPAVMPPQISAASSTAAEIGSVQTPNSPEFE